LPIGNQKDHFDIGFIKNICPSDFDKFEFLPSMGASGGILLALKSLAF
jgi:hypothetical protein